MTIQEISEKLARTIDENAEEILAIGEQVRQTPELGYCEQKTSALVREKLDAWGIPYAYPLALTGVKAKLGGRAHRFNVCLIGEMDALRCEGKNAHACGHNAQIAALLGSALALSRSGVMRELDGDVTFFAVPSEEFIEFAYRRELREQGKIRYFGGKQQLIADGAFDDVDMAMMIHAQGNEPQARFYVRGHNLGFLAKTMTLRGKAVHGSTPFDGVNALNAAALAILGIHANRETFREEERIRIHPIITKGGDVVNAVPDEVCIETYVRGASLDAIRKGNRVVERAVKGACEMIGANAQTEDIPGYLPLSESLALSEVAEEAARRVLGDDALVFDREITGSSDIGDLSQLIPTIQPSIGGFEGTLHSTAFRISDTRTAYLSAAKILSLSAASLLTDGARAAMRVRENFHPTLSKQDYLNYLNNREE